MKRINHKITSNEIRDGEVKTSDIADAAVTSAKIADGAVTNAKIAGGAITLDKLASNTIVVPIVIPIPDSKQSGLAADSTGVKWTSSFKLKWRKTQLKKVRIRATWTSTATDNVVKIAVKDDSTGADIVYVSGNAGTDVESETTDLANVTDDGTATVYAEVTTASGTSGATFDIAYVIIELEYGYS